MAKNDFTVTSIFKIIIRICKKIFELFAKHPNFYQKESIEKMKFLTLPRTKQKTKQEEKKYNPTS